LYYNKEGYVFVSGAPEMLFSRCTRALNNGNEEQLTSRDKQAFSDALQEMSRSSLRVVAYAYKPIKSKDISMEEAESALVFIGMFGLIDPPRKDAKEAVELCRQAGIRVLMLTGDHADTAVSIAKEVGIDASKVMTGQELDEISDAQLLEVVKNVNVYARVSPEHKLRIADALKKNGEIVAVTGDGINDAPALSNASIGIAMGETGTDVAREAAGMILVDDNFATIAGAVRQGRKIFDNLKKGIRYYLSCKFALIIIFLLPVLLGLALPFAPVQIIVLELFMDIAASTGFSVEVAEPDIMSRKPRNTKERFLDRKMITSIAVSGLCLVAAVLASYLFAVYTGASPARAQTMAFSAWIIGHIFLALNMRSENEPLLKLGLLSNKVIVVWLLSAVAMVLLAVNLPFMHTALKTTYIGLADWLFVIVAAFIATFWIEVKKLVLKPKLGKVVEPQGL
jgi:Ca2+-transporting ATPase